MCVGGCVRCAAIVSAISLNALRLHPAFKILYSSLLSLGLQCLQFCFGHLTPSRFALCANQTKKKKKHSRVHKPKHCISSYLFVSKRISLAPKDRTLPK